jgi:tRNA threonylcarbamoyladenosine biosynthesis protein TsaE
MTEFETGSSAETEQLAARLCAVLRRGDLVTVAGDLGAGKTTFVRGACGALGVTEAVTSPTFALGHLYRAPIPVAHLDLYRLVASDRDAWGDLEPYFDGTIAFVEWPEHGAAWLPAPRAAVVISHRDAHSRLIRIDGDDDLRL